MHPRRTLSWSESLLFFRTRKPSTERKKQPCNLYGGGTASHLIKFPKRQFLPEQSKFKGLVPLPHHVCEAWLCSLRLEHSRMESDCCWFVLSSQTPARKPLKSHVKGLVRGWERNESHQHGRSSCHPGGCRKRAIRWQRTGSLWKMSRGMLVQHTSLGPGHLSCAKSFQLMGDFFSIGTYTHVHIRLLELVWFQINLYHSSHRGSVETNPTRNHEVVGSVPGLTQWVKNLA